jgi:hypothetical protein
LIAFHGIFSSVELVVTTQRRLPPGRVRGRR